MLFQGSCILATLVVLCIIPVAAYLGPCPIGTDGAPYLRDTGLTSGALCRGACGIDCPSHRCEPQEDYVKVINKGTASQGICTYANTVSCDSHQGCRDHDACYDVCTESRGETSLMGACHWDCNNDCFATFGYTSCALWADIPGSIMNKLGTAVDYSAAPSFDRFMYFSDPPTFTPKPVTTTPTRTTVTTTRPPTTVPTTTRVTSVPITTTAPVTAVSGPASETTEPPLTVQRQTCISLGGTWDYSVEACYIPPTTVPTTAAPIIGVPEIFKDKPIIQYTPEDFQKAADDAMKNGRYDLAIQYLDAAESIYLKDNPVKSSRPASVDEALADLESSKSAVYHSWPGHETEEAIANQNVKNLESTAASKSSSFDLPGFEVWAALLSVMSLVLVRRIRQ